MSTYSFPSLPLPASRLAYGCMEITGGWDAPLNPTTIQDALQRLHTALECGINFFDHADIYAEGRSEEAFSHLWKDSPSRRNDLLLQSKCGIRFGQRPHPGDPTRFDFSQKHVLSAVDGILARLKTDRLDLLLLHRPDALCEPEEVAAAFDQLHRSGKVLAFGVSNHNAAQIALLQHHLRQPLLVNQVELNLRHFGLIEEGLAFNQPPAPLMPPTTGGTLEYCRLHNIRLQAWAPLARGALCPSAPQPEPHLAPLRETIATMAAAKNIPSEALQLAWLLRHPAGIQPILGTKNPERLRACALAEQVTLSREEWYTLLTAARGKPV